MNKEIIITVGDLIVHLTYKQVKRINMRMKSSDGHIFMSAPPDVSIKEVKAIVIKNQTAILNTISRIKNKGVESPSYDYISGDLIKYLGEDYTLSVTFVVHKRLRRIEINHHMHTLKMEAWESSTSDVRHQQLLSFYKVQLSDILTNLVEEWTLKLNVSVSKVRMRQMKTRWGSCSSSGNLSFNLALIKLPYELIELIVVHELAHRLEMNHGTGFYAILNKHLPNNKELSNQLKSYSTEV